MFRKKNKPFFFTSTMIYKLTNSLTLLNQKTSKPPSDFHKALGDSGEFALLRAGTFLKGAVCTASPALGVFGGRCLMRFGVCFGLGRRKGLFVGSICLKGGRKEGKRVRLVEGLEGDVG